MPFVFRPPGTAASAGAPKASGGRSPSYSPVSQRGAHDTNAPGTIMMLAIMMLARPLRCRCYTCRSRAHEENHTELYMLVMSMGAAGTSSSYVICAGLSGHLWVLACQCRACVDCQDSTGLKGRQTREEREHAREGFLGWMLPNGGAGQRVQPAERKGRWGRGKAQQQQKV